MENGEKKEFSDGDGETEILKIIRLLCLVETAIF